MPTRELPRRPNLEHLRNESRELQRLVRSGDPGALAEVREHHPGAVPAAPALRLTSAQVVVARRYGFPSWARLRRHVLQVDELYRLPVPPPEDDGDLPARFLWLACLTYAGDDRRRPTAAVELLARHPEVVTHSAHTMAAAGEADALRALLRDDRAAAHRQGGPLEWPPLLYATYSRVPPADGRSTLASARTLLEAGADPDAGYLWDGAHPFTALTGAFGGGEDDAHQPPHPESRALARLLLEAGADPNDTQAVYNRMFRPATDHLELLFAHGLGRTPSAWAARIGPLAMPIETSLAMDLQWAAGHGFGDKARFLLDHGVDPDRGSGHPTFGGRSAHELAERAGYPAIAELLAARGAVAAPLDDVGSVVAAALRGDRAAVEATLARDPAGDLRGRVEATRPLATAAASGRLDAVRLLLDLGFDVDGTGDGGGHRTTALHEAAAVGDLAIVRELVARGADPAVLDRSFDATPLGWARHHGRDEVAAFLDPLTPPDDA